jgi:hypothetical protein
VNGADGFDIGLLVVPRWVARLIVVGLFLASGGGFALWYAQQKAEGVQEVVETFTDSLFGNLSTPPTPSPTTQPFAMP